MAKILPEDVEARAQHLSEKDRAGLEAWANFTNAGDESMAMHILAELSKGAKTLISGLFALKKTREKEEKK